jgi:hypothetical protein
MPFTFSHPAIILPLAYLPRKWFSLTGLIIGSFTPDFEYFIRMSIRSDYSHTPFGLLWFDLPLGVLMAFVYHNIVRNRLLDNLPIVLRSRLAVFKQFSWNQYVKHSRLAVIFSVLIGAASHLLWDSFTHEHGYFVQAIPVLTDTFNLWSIRVPYLKLLQHGSTLAGGSVIIYVLLSLPQTQIPARHIEWKYWSIVIGLVLIILSIRLATGLNYRMYGHLVVSGISAVMISLIVTPLFIGRKQTTNK